MTCWATSRGGTNASSSTSITITLPTGSIPGDVIVEALLIQGTVTNVTWPAGWTAIVAPTALGTYVFSCYYRTVVAGDPATISVTWTTATTTKDYWGVLVKSGANAGVTLDASGSNTGTGTAVTGSAVTGAYRDCVSVLFVAFDSTSTTKTPVYPYWSAFAQASGGNNVANAVECENYGKTAVPAASFTLGASRNWRAVQCVFSDGGYLVSNPTAVTPNTFPGVGVDAGAGGGIGVYTAA